MSIRKREVLYSAKGDQVKFLDWAVVQTSLGACAEPFVVNDRGLGGNSTSVDFDPSDMMVKVDGLRRVEDEGAAKKAMFGGDMPLHGGNALPRVTIFTGNN